MGFIRTLVSSSSGNSILYHSKNTSVLIDAGVSCSKICSAITALSDNSGGAEGIEEIDGIFITHEHTDHISGVKILVNRKKRNVYGNEKTIEKIIQKNPDINKEYLHIIKNDELTAFKDIEIKAFSTSHDSADSVGYTINDGHTKIGIATDIGIVTDNVRDNLKKCRKCIIEANHDEQMLLASNYPYSLKRRILSDTGHLSNTSSAEFIFELMNSFANEILLAHLSKQNNVPALAYETVREYLFNKKAAGDISIDVAPYDNASVKLEW